MNIRRPIVESPAGWELDEFSRAGIEDVGNVISHQGRVIPEALGNEQLCSVYRKVIKRRTIAARTAAGKLLDDGDRTLHPIMFLLPRQCVWRLVDISMKTHLVPVLEHRFNGFGIFFNAPGRNEERLFQSETAIAVQNAGHAHFRTIFEHRNRRDAGNGILRVVDVDEAVGVHVETYSYSDLGAVRPRNGTGDHGALPFELDLIGGSTTGHSWNRRPSVPAV
jgi:hypothetical protein